MPLALLSWQQGQELRDWVPGRRGCCPLEAEAEGTGPMLHHRRAGRQAEGP